MTLHLQEQSQLSRNKLGVRSENRTLSVVVGEFKIKWFLTFYDVDGYELPNSCAFPRPLVTCWATSLAFLGSSD